MKTGLFFGSFNPVHNGHTSIAEHILRHSDLEEIWFVVSPENPWKTEQKKPSSALRLKMVQLAIENKKEFWATNFEEELPKPSYTYRSLIHLQQQYPNNEFVLLIGGDNLSDFHKWRDYTKILDEFMVWAYPRKGDMHEDNLFNIKQVKAPLLNISSTEIRLKIKSGQTNMQEIDDKVLNFIREKKLYQS